MTHRSLANPPPLPYVAPSPLAPSNVPRQRRPSYVVPPAGENVAPSMPPATVAGASPPTAYAATASYAATPDPVAYGGQGTSYAGPATSYAGQPTAYAGPATSYAGQSTAAYAGQPTAYVGQPTTSYADQTAAYAGQPATYAGPPAGYGGQPLYVVGLGGQSTSYYGQPTTYGGQPTTAANPAQGGATYGGQPTANVGPTYTTFAGQPSTYLSPAPYAGQAGAYGGDYNGGLPVVTTRAVSMNRMRAPHGHSKFVVKKERAGCCAGCNRCWCGACEAGRACGCCNCRGCCEREKKVLRRASSVEAIRRRMEAELPKKQRKESRRRCC